MTRRRRPGPGYAAAALTALAFFSAACDSTPAPKGVLGVERTEDGGVRLLLADCPGYAARDFSVLEDTEGGDTMSWSVHNGGAGAAVRDVRAFQAPPEGWRSTDDSLTALREGVPYVATVNGFVNGRNLRGRVPFTAADLAGLGGGQVLAWAGGDDTVKTGRDAFLRADPDRCRP
ncbi:hypothetical protein [Microbispora sp. KK1-11]|uniref:hypothetical protein n=1 Tax=Microbispora sp. KK1-11 TaxID=2053005 RepID=UPI0011584CE0|nr:hypothetical protein [Microbispora sp. KK1-11]TQS28279.1 hypothetical protein FLW16_15590 [Microbispora sp. KK1-11]